METQTTTDAIWSQLSLDLRRFIRRRVPDDHVADDLLQETFLRVHRRIETLQEADRLVAWVYQIARNVVHDHHRRAINAPVTLTDAEHMSDGAHERQSGCRNIKWLHGMIQSLPEGYRQAVQMAEIEELPQQNIADRMGLSLSGAKSRIQRGRAMLKDVLQRCCSFELDVRGRVIGCDPRPSNHVCPDCRE